MRSTLAKRMQTYLADSLRTLMSQNIRVEMSNLVTPNYSTVILDAGLRELLSYSEPVRYLGFSECPIHRVANRDIEEDTNNKYSARVTICLGRLRKTKLHIMAEIDEIWQPKTGRAELKVLYLKGEDE
jgi:hypothetical protein